MNCKSGTGKQLKHPVNKESIHADTLEIFVFYHKMLENFKPEPMYKIDNDLSE